MRELKFNLRQTGYDQKDTDFLITVKDQGTAPDINVYMSGQYQGHLELSERGAIELARHLLFVCGVKP